MFWNFGKETRNPYLNAKKRKSKQFWYFLKDDKIKFFWQFVVKRSLHLWKPIQGIGTRNFGVKCINFLHLKRLNLTFKFF